MHWKWSTPNAIRGRGITANSCANTATSYRLLDTERMYSVVAEVTKISAGKGQSHRLGAPCEPRCWRSFFSAGKGHGERRSLGTGLFASLNLHYISAVAVTRSSGGNFP